MADSPAFYEERIRLLQAEKQSHDSMIDTYRREIAAQTERAEKAEAENQRLRDALADIRNAVHDEQWSNTERLQAISDWSSTALDETLSHHD